MILTFKKGSPPEWNKRHTAVHVSSTQYACLAPGVGGYRSCPGYRDTPSSPGQGVVPHPVLSGEVHHPNLARGYPHPVLTSRLPHRVPYPDGVPPGISGNIMGWRWVIPLGKDMGPIWVLWDGDIMGWILGTPNVDRHTPVKTVPSPSLVLSN